MTTSCFLLSEPVKKTRLRVKITDNEESGVHVERVVADDLNTIVLIKFIDDIVQVGDPREEEELDRVDLSDPRLVARRRRALRERLTYRVERDDE